MPILTVIAFLHWLVALGVLVWGLSEESPFLIALAIATAIAGILFLAFERVISLLTDIRDAVGPKIHPDKKSKAERIGGDEENFDPATQSLKDDLDRIRAGLPPIEKPS
ncbi:hypothetical protein [Ruegeria sp.]|uniref:hypothetical protein n=1 Tax=Ruegeria sp. TaxID=1879320 RepID=UPI003B5A1F83